MDKIEDFTNIDDVSDAAIEWVLRVTNCDCFTAASVRRGAEDNYGADGARIIAARLIERHYPELLVDPLLVEAREVCACMPGVNALQAGEYRSGRWDAGGMVDLALAALRRGTELGRSDPVRPPLTVEVVREAMNKVWSDTGEQMTVTGFADRLHAALTDGGRDE